MLTAQQPQLRQIPDLSKFVTARVVAPYDVLPSHKPPDRWCFIGSGRGARVQW